MDRGWDRPKDKTREMESDSCDGTRERLPATRGRDGEMDWREREKRRDGDYRVNGRIESVSERGDNRDRENERGKGDTFPRITRPSKERDGRIPLQEYERQYQTGRPKEMQYESERERERERERRRQRDAQRYRDLDIQSERDRTRNRDEMRKNETRRLLKEDPERWREQEREFDSGKRDRRRESYPGVNDHWSISEREAGRERDRHRQRERDSRFYSPQLRHNEGERDNFSGKEERAERQREGQRPRRRDTRSEGDSDGDREKERRKEEDSKLGHKHYKSEGDSEAERTLDRIRERDRRKEREVERHRELAMLRERETDYQGPRGERSERYREPGRLREGDIEKRTERPKDRMRDTQGRRKDYMERDAYSYTTERGRYKEGERTRERDRYIERVETAERERRRRENRETGRSNLSLSEANREKNGQSTGERLSGGDAENEQGRPKRENFEKDNEKESSKDRDKEGMFEIDKEKLKGKKEGEQDKDRKLESDMEKPKRKPRKMWLEPRSGNERKESSLEDEYIEREKARERYIQRYKTTGDEEQSYMPREPEREQERMSLEDRYRELEKAGEFARDLGVEREEKRRSGGMEYDREELEPHWQMEKDNVTDDTEEIDQEEKRGNNNARLENEEGSEGESEEEKDKMMSADDGFVTVSSGGEDDFEDCKEFWDGGVRDDLTEQSKQMQDKEVRKDEDMENKTTNESDYQSVTLFCVVGQTHDSSQAKDNPLEDHTAEEMTGQHLDHDNQAEVNIANVNEDSEKDRSTVQDIEREMDDLTLSHKEDEGSHDTKGEETGSNDQSAKDATLPEGHMIENEPLPQEPSETSDLIKDNGSAATEAHSENTLEEGRKENTEATVEHSNSEETWASADERKRYSSAPHLKWAKSVVKEILDSESLVVDKENARGTHIDTQSNTQTESEREMDELREEKGVMEGGEEEKGGMEKESNEGSEHDWLDPGSVQDTFSSEGELDREGGEIEAEKRDSVKELSVLSSSSFRDLGNEARIRRRGFRKSAEKRSEEEEGEGVGRDRRTRIFNISDEDEEEFSFSWSEVDLRKVTESLRRPIRRNSKFFNSQLYQEYSEVVQNREIQLSHSDSIALSGDYSGSSVRSSSSPNHSPKPQHRPLPALPPVPLHPHTLSITNSFRSLIVPQQVPNRPPSPRLSISASSPTLWQDLPGVRSSPELEDLAEDERRLQEVRFEVVTSEASYCRSLDIVVEHFVKSKQLNVLLTSQDKNWLFSRLSDVRAISHSFLSQLEERVESDIMHFTVCDIIIKHCPRFRKVYVPYLTNQSYQDKTYQRLMDENHEFRRSVEKLERNPVCQRLPLRSFLILPFQRITRLKLLVQNIVKRTAPKTKDEAQAIKAMKLLEKMIQESNDSISQMKNIESLVSLSAKVDFECRTLPLISQSRRLVREGPVTELRDFSLKETERSVYMHLFNDYLLLSLRKEGGRFTVIDHAPVSELRAENCRFKLHSLQKNLFRLHTAHKALLLRTDTQAEKLRWISALSRPHPEIDFSAVQDFAQVQCIRAYVAQQPDELSLEKADVLLVHQQSTDGWVEGTRLSDRQRGWAPDTHLETIVSDKAKKRNLLDTMKIASAAM